MNEKVFIGSAYEGAEGMFQPIEASVHEAIEADVNKTRLEREIYPDLHERFEALLEEKNWKQVREIAPELTYPTADEWVAHRIANNRGTKFYPSFVEDEEGNTFFVKVNVTSKPDQVNGLYYEAVILHALRDLNIRSPKYIDYEPPEKNSLSYIQLEAISFDEGRVGFAEEWTPDHAQDVALQVKEIEEKDIVTLSEQLQELPSFNREVNVIDRMLDLSTRALEHIPENLRQRIQSLSQGDKVKETLVHGDLTLKNIIINREGSATIVDWELAGKGFLGQDAGKLLSQLSTNEEAKQAFLNAYLTKENGERDNERWRSLTVGTVVENLVHLVWRVENIVSKGQTTEQTYQEIEHHRAMIEQALLDYETAHNEEEVAINKV